MISAPVTPGAQVPKDPIKYPPKLGAITRVKLSREADNPNVPPTSSLVTTFVKALLSTVLRIPLVIARGIKINSNATNEEVKAQPAKEIPKMIVDINITHFSG